jgi:hypothetical protein
MDVDLVVLCASHINNKARLRAFELMVDSWCSQVVPVKMYVSMSLTRESWSEDRYGGSTS